MEWKRTGLDTRLKPEQSDQALASVLRAQRAVASLRADRFPDPVPLPPKKEARAG